MSDKYFTDEFALPLGYIKEEKFIPLGINVAEYLNSLKKTCKSANIQKNKISHNFFGELEEKYKEEMFAEEEKLVGDKLNIEYRRNKAVEIINSIKEGENELKYIKEALSFDNTNKYVIFKLLKYYYDKKDQIKFDEAINRYKFCITKQLKVRKGKEETIINLEKFFKIKIPIMEYEEHPNLEKIETNIYDLRNFVVFLFNQFYYIGEAINKIKKYLKTKDLKEILTIRFEDSGKKMCKLCFDYEKKETILNTLTKVDEKARKELIPLMENFLCRYLQAKEFESFRNNQPISYEYNLTFFYNYIIYYFYDLVIEVNESGKQLIFKKAKLLTYFNMIHFHDLIFDENLDKKVPFNGTINQLLQFLLLLSSTDKVRKYSFQKYPFHLSKFDSFLDSSLADKYINILENENDLFAKKLDDKIVLKESEDELATKIEIKYKYYSRNILEEKKEKRENMNYLWENIQFEKFQLANFFLEEDLKYLKYLIKVILSSNLFKVIFQTYSDISSLADYYFNDPKNIQDYIDRIIFLPFKVSDIGKYAITDRFLLSVLVAGYPEKEISDLNEYKIYRIIELSLRSLILGEHEPLNFIKGVYSTISEGKISRYTSKTNNKIDSGFFLEEILFGWVQVRNSALDLSKFNLQEENEYQNEALINKRIDLITAITLLNPEIYSKDLSYFRKCVFGIKREDLENFTFDSLNPAYPEYKAYLQSVIEEEAIRDCYKSKDISISAAMKFDDSSIGYIQFNHNEKN